MRTWGFVLLFWGFLWLVALPPFMRADNTSRFSDAYDSLPDQTTFSREEVRAHMMNVYRLLQPGDLPIWFPGLVLLIGGLFVSRGGKTQRSASPVGPGKLVL